MRWPTLLTREQKGSGMTTLEQIARLKALGYGVRVDHKRRIRGLQIPMSRGTARKFFPGYIIEPRGGMTTVTIYDRVKCAGEPQTDGSFITFGESYWVPSDTILVESFAFCSDRDNFDRRRGLQIAFGRAVKAAGQLP